MLKRGDLTLAETFGLTNPGSRLSQIKLALGGDPHTPATKWGVSSLGVFTPALSVKTWLGWKPADRLVPVSNLFNRTQTPIMDGWSVRKTQVLDFRGGKRTYDSHNGTDLAIPPATLVVTPAPGVVRRVSDEFHRGGLKILIDHGSGLITTSNHLGRALVSVGDVVARGQAIALSAYSGIDSVISFPWSVPHVHFNTWVNGIPVDPFAAGDETSLWRVHNNPRPYLGSHDDDGYEYTPCEWNLDDLDSVISGCKDPEVKAELKSISDLDDRAINTIFMKNYFPTRFETSAPIYQDEHPRTPLLDLPFSPEDYVGIRLF